MRFGDTEGTRSAVCCDQQPETPPDCESWGVRWGVEGRARWEFPVPPINKINRKGNNKISFQESLEMKAPVFLSLIADLRGQKNNPYTNDSLWNQGDFSGRAPHRSLWRQLLHLLGECLRRVAASSRAILFGENKWEKKQMGETRICLVIH